MMFSVLLSALEVSFILFLTFEASFPQQNITSNGKFHLQIQDHISFFSVKFKTKGFYFSAALSFLMELRSTNVY